LNKALVGTISTQQQHLSETKNAENKQFARNVCVYSNNIYYVKAQDRTYVIVQCYDPLKSEEIYGITKQVSVETLVGQSSSRFIFLTGRMLRHSGVGF
jgi:hypothetical protein